MTHLFRHKLVCILLLGLVGVSGLTGCVKTVEDRGYVTRFSDFDTVKIGESTKAEVQQKLGTPSTKSNFGEEVWYYISTRSEHVAFITPKIVGQDVHVVAFDAGGVVSRVEKRGLEDARRIDFADDVTPTEGNELGAIEQLLGNLGRFNPDQGAGR